MAIDRDDKEKWRTQYNFNLPLSSGDIHDGEYDIPQQRAHRRALPRETPEMGDDN